MGHRRARPPHDAGIDWNAATYEQVNSVQRWLAARSLAGLKLRGDERLLDVGCGDGQITATLADRLPDGSALGIDASPRMVAAARAHAPADGRLRFEDGNVLTMSYVAAFDLVVSFNVLHWVHEQRSAFRRIHTALRPNGWALLQFVCGGERSSLEDTAMQVGSTSSWRSWFDGFEPPYLHPDPETVRTDVAAEGFAVESLTVDDLNWDFDTAADFARWCRAGFSAWTARLPDDATADAFVDDVVDAYAEVTGSDRLFRFRQLRTILRRD